MSENNNNDDATEPDFYKLLGISRTSTQQEIEKAYRKQSLRFHPDKNEDSGEMMKLLNEAKKILLDPDTRAEYDVKMDDQGGFIEDITGFLSSGGLHWSKLFEEMMERSKVEWEKTKKFESPSKFNQSLIQEIQNICFKMEEKTGPHIYQKAPPNVCPGCFQSFPDNRTLAEHIEQHDTYPKFLEELKEGVSDFTEILQWSECPYKAYTLGSLEAAFKSLPPGLLSVLKTDKALPFQEVLQKPAARPPWMDFVPMEPSIGSNNVNYHVRFNESKAVRAALSLQQRTSSPSSSENMVPIFDWRSLPKNIQQHLTSHFGSSSIVPSFARSSPPSFSNELNSSCSECKKSFWFFQSKHQCRSCGSTICANCVQHSQFCQYGIYEAAAVCGNCLQQLHQLFHDKWCQAAWNAINSGQVGDCLAILSFLHDVYPEYISESKWLILASDYSKHENGLLPSITCRMYGKESQQQIISTLAQLGKEHKYADLNAAIHLVSQYLSGALVIPVIREIALANFSQAMVLYRTASLSSTQYADEATYWWSIHQYSIAACCFHLASMSPLSWLSLAKRSLGNKNSSLAMYCLSKSNASTKKWIKYAEKLLQQSPNNILEWTACVENAFQQIPDRWNSMFKEACSLKRVPLAFWCLTRTKAEPSIWIKWCIELIKNRSELSQLCVRYAKHFVSIGALQMQFSDFLAAENYVGVLLCVAMELVPETWTEVGDFFLKKGRVDCAYLCWRMQCKIDESFWKAKLSQIQSMSNPILVALHSLAYETSRDVSYPLAVAEIFCQSGHAEWALETAASGMRSWTSSTSKSLRTRYHLLIAKCLRTFNDVDATLVLEACKYAEKENEGQPLPAQVSKQMLDLEKEIQTKRKEQIARKVGALKISYSERNHESTLMQLIEIFHTEDIKTIDAFLEEHKLQVSSTHQLPPEDKALFLIAQSIQQLFRGETATAVNGLLKAALACPVSDIIIGPVASILSDTVLRFQLVAQMLKELKSLRDFNQISGLAVAETPMPDTHQYAHWFSKSKAVRGLRENEKGLMREFSGDYVKMALWYCNLVQAAPDTSTSIACVLLAGHYFALSCEKEGPTADGYASKTAAFECCKIAGLFADKTNPAIRIYASRTATAIALRVAKAMKGIGCEGDGEDIASWIEKTVKLTPLFPAIISPMMLAVDTLFLSTVSSDILGKLMKLYKDQEDFPLLLPERVDYFHFEGRWQGWLDYEEDKEEKEDNNNNDDSSKEAKVQDETRNTCMESNLIAQGWTWENVQQLLQSFNIPRTKEGWIENKVASFGEFYSLDGFEVDEKSGTIRLFATPANPKQNKPGLFGWKDISQVFQNGIGSSFFSLDQGDIDYHLFPFQKMRFGPASLSGTSFLDTLFHTDYLLKFFSTGVEVSSIPPFNMRPVNAGLLDRLPAYLQKKLCVISNQPSSSGEAHRFWIEPGEIPYHQDTKQDDKLVINFGKVDVQVKKHLLMRNERGELVDAPQDDSDKTPEAEFAREFTNNYEDIGKYFPEFLRLRELLKIAAMYTCIHAQKKMLEEKASDANIDKFKLSIQSQLKNNFDQTWRKVAPYPKAENYNLIEGELSSAMDRAKSDITSRYGYSAWTWQLESEARSKLRTQIVQQLRDVDRQQVDALVKQINEAYNMSISSWVVQTWMTTGDSSTLSTQVAAAMAKEIQGKYQNLCKELKSLNFNLTESPISAEAVPSKTHTCPWVPAALNKKNHRLVFGGVSMNVRLQQANVTRPPASSQYSMSAQTLNAQRSNAIPNSNAQRMDNLKNFNNQQEQIKVEAAKRSYAGRMQRYRETADDPKQPTWLRQQMKRELQLAQERTYQYKQERMEKYGPPQDSNKTFRVAHGRPRNPQGWEFAHYRGMESAKGNNYQHTFLQQRSLHVLQHKYDGQGRKNKPK